MDSYNFIEIPKVHRMTFAYDKVHLEDKPDAENIILDVLEGIKDPSIDAFVDLVTEEFGKISTSDELDAVLEVTESYKDAILNNKKEFFWSYTAPINKLARYEIRGKKIVQA